LDPSPDAAEAAQRVLSFGKVSHTLPVQSWLAAQQLVKITGYTLPVQSWLAAQQFVKFTEYTLPVQS